MELQFALRQFDGGMVASVAGEVDINTAPVLQDRLRVVVARTQVILDLSAVEFMDAAGLSALVRLDRIATRGGRRLRLAAPPANLAKILRITHLDRRLSVHADLDEAIAAEDLSIP